MGRTLRWTFNSALPPAEASVAARRLCSAKVAAGVVSLRNTVVHEEHSDFPRHGFIVSQCFQIVTTPCDHLQSDFVHRQQMAMAYIEWDTEYYADH